MIKRRLLIFSLALSLLFSISSGCQSKEANLVIDSIYDTPNHYNSNQDINYKSVAIFAKEKANSFIIKDKQRWIWTIRAIMDAEIKGKQLTDFDIVMKADALMEKNKNWFILAQKYGVDVSDEELNNFINTVYNEGKNSSQAKQVAEGLGIELKELFYSFDADVYKKNLVWKKLRPILQKKHNIEDNNELIKKFNEELRLQCCQNSK